jgi:hypothetical protein
MVRPVSDKEHLVIFERGPRGQKIKYGRSLSSGELVSRFPSVPANRLSVEVPLNP